MEDILLSFRFAKAWGKGDGDDYKYIILPICYAMQCMGMGAWAPNIFIYNYRVYLREAVGLGMLQS